MKHYCPEQSVYVVTMFPRLWVTVLQCLLDPWNLASVRTACLCAFSKSLNENIFSIFSKTSSNSPPPKENSWKERLCRLWASRWLRKWFSKCFFDREFWLNRSKSLNRSSKSKLNDWWNGLPLLPLPPWRPSWSYSLRLFSSDNVSYAIYVKKKKRLLPLHKEQQLSLPLFLNQQISNKTVIQCSRFIYLSLNQNKLLQNSYLQ